MPQIGQIGCILSSNLMKQLGHEETLPANVAPHMGQAMRFFFGVVVLGGIRSFSPADGPNLSRLQPRQALSSNCHTRHGVLYISGFQSGFEAMKDEKPL